MELHCVYLAPPAFIDDLATELVRHGIPILWQREHLFGVGKKVKSCVQDTSTQLLTEEPHATGRGRGDMLYGWHGDVFHPIWAENIWYAPQLLRINSIGDAAKQLRSMQRNWRLYSTLDHRRAALIHEKLPIVKERPFHFGQEPYDVPLGSWTLWSRDEVLASAYCSSPFAHGNIPFAEDKKTPPNRAYLKLWEAFTRLKLVPQKGSLCLDLGSSPGGWSWVLAELGASVFSVDKAPLAPHIDRHPLVSHCIGSAFGLEPQTVGDIDWLFSDIACYPERLLQLVQNYLEYIPRINMLCTIKLTGATDFDAIDTFLSIPGSFARHLTVNKHEITWCYLAKPEALRSLPV